MRLPHPLRSLTMAACLLALAPTTVAASPAPVDPLHRDDGTTSFIVTLRSGVDAGDVAEAYESDGVAVSHVYQHVIDGFAGRMDPDVAERLEDDDRVARVEPDRVVSISAATAQSAPPWGLDRVDQRALPLDRSFRYNADGSSVTAYVIDTGVRATHNDLRGRVGTGFSVIDDGRGTDDCQGHGTHVAGTIGGTVHGVAKAVTVVPVRVLGCDGRGATSGVIAGVDWITAHHAAGAPAVANMSLGGGVSSSLENAVRRAIADGVVFSVAAGNDDADACNVSPARLPEAITVGATTSTDRRSSFSNRGPCVDLFAPGSAILSAHHTSDTATVQMSGTSMAAPHVAGIAARHLSRRPEATPAEVHDAVIGGATPGVVIDPAGTPNRLAFSGVK